MTEKIEIVNIKDVAGILKPADITELVKKAEELEFQKQEYQWKIIDFL